MAYYTHKNGLFNYVHARGNLQELRMSDPMPVASVETG